MQQTASQRQRRGCVKDGMLGSPLAAHPVLSRVLSFCLLRGCHPHLLLFLYHRVEVPQTVMISGEPARATKVSWFIRDRIHDTQGF